LFVLALVGGQEMDYSAQIGMNVLQILAARRHLVRIPKDLMYVHVFLVGQVMVKYVAI
jgi:hypothetical protein